MKKILSLTALASWIGTSLIGAGLMGSMPAQASSFGDAVAEGATAGAVAGVVGAFFGARPPVVAPVVVAPQPVIVQPAPVIVQPAPVVVTPGYGPNDNPGYNPGYGCGRGYGHRHGGGYGPAYPAPAPAPDFPLSCESVDRQLTRCDARAYVQAVTLERQLSNAPCAEGYTWGADATGVWVRGGCRAVFRVYPRY